MTTQAAQPGGPYSWAIKANSFVLYGRAISTTIVSLLAWVMRAPTQQVITAF
jgi:hypothetical protein